MKFPTRFSGSRLTALCLAALLVSACGNQREIQRANDAYQQALALGDINGQRRALLALTKADDGVSDYWIELAKLDIQVGAYGDAYSNFSRAHELDRTAVLPLSMMTELSVINGRVDLAEDHLEALTVIAPNDRAVSIARGFTALRQGKYEEAQKNVDGLIAQSPRDSVANVLQTRILVAQKKFPEAIDFLNRKLPYNASDRAMLRSLGAIQRYLGNWREAAAADARVWKLNPADVTVAQRTVADALKAKDMALANEITGRFLAEARTGEEAIAVLSLWVDLAAGTAPSVAGGAMPEHSKIAYAHYLNRAGKPDQALAMLGPTPRPLGERANVDFNATFAEAMFLKGRIEPAHRILDRVLRDEPDDTVALSARARLLSKIGNHRDATADAQRLVASYDTMAEYRVLLAQIYRANRDNRWAERALWDGYRDLPANETLFKQIQAMLIARGDRDGLARLNNDHDKERFSLLMKELA